MILATEEQRIVIAKRRQDDTDGEETKQYFVPRRPPNYEPRDSDSYEETKAELHGRFEDAWRTFFQEREVETLEDVVGLDNRFESELPTLLASEEDAVEPTVENVRRADFYGWVVDLDTSFGPDRGSE